MIPQCDGTKKIYDTEKQAKESSHYMRRYEGNTRLHAYYCRDCHGYHLGHGRTNRKKKMRSFYR